MNLFFFFFCKKKYDCQTDETITQSIILGHKFAGNVICYINKGKTGVWYGRVKSCHCREIIEETIIQGKVIKELYRGSMSQSFGKVNESKCNRIKW